MLSVHTNMFIIQNIYNLLFFIILLIIADLSIQTPSHLNQTTVKKCSPKLSNLIDIFCELNGITQDCTREVPEGTISYMNCKLNYIDIRTPGPSLSICRNGEWNLPLKRCTPECNQIVPKGHTNIVKGNSAERGEFPWHVAIYRQKPGEPQKYICGGSIISDKVVISAAHCFTEANTGTLYPISEYSVAAGKYYSDWNAPEDAYFVQKRQLKKIEIPVDKYFGGLTNYAADIAALVVNNAFIFTSFVKPVCVDWNLDYANRQLTDGTLGKVAGWGATSTYSPAVSGELKQLTIPYIGRSQCIEIVPRNFVPFVTLDKYCAGYTNGTSVCGGDSGGGMVIPYEDSGKKRYYLEGIVSAGPGKEGSCDDYQIGVYTRVTEYITFIRRIEEANRLNAFEKVQQSCVAPTIENGKFTVAGGIDYKPGSLIEASSVIIIECNRGYEKSVNNFPVCMSGVWIKEIPKCVFVLPTGKECPAPLIENGKYDVLGFAQYNIGDPIPNLSVVNFTCENDNFVLDTTYNLINCINGIFSFNIPKCVSTRCPARFSNSIEVDCQLNGVKQDCSKDVPAGTVATMKCKSKEETYDGPATATCSRGSWDIPLKECAPECQGSYMISEESIQDCGEIRFNATKEIDFVKRGDAPWHVGIYRKEPKDSIYLTCGGSIISEKIVLSVAHRFTEVDTAKHFPISEFYVAAGKHYEKWDNPKDVGFVQTRKICKVHIPSIYDGTESDVDFRGNIAVLVVDKPFEFSNAVKPICVDWNSEYADQQIIGGALGIVTGWGYGNGKSPILTYVTAPIVDLLECFKTVPSGGKSYVIDDKYCAGSLNGSNLCSVDHGGAMVFPYEKFGKKKYIIQGIKSQYLAADDCESKLLFTFTRVVDYIDFIKNVTSFSQMH